MRYLISYILLVFTLSTLSQDQKNLDAIWTQIFTKEHVNSPYQPAIFNTNFKYNNSLNFHKAIEELETKAKKRQLHLEEKWKELKKENSPKYELLEYIFTQKPHSFLEKKLNKFPDNLKFEAARLLISECNFEKGIPILLDLHKSLDNKNALKKRVIFYLKKYSLMFETITNYKKFIFHDLSEFKKQAGFIINEIPIEQVEIEPIEAERSDRGIESPGSLEHESNDNLNPIYIFRTGYGAYLHERNIGKFWSPEKQNQITLKSKFRGTVEYELFFIKDNDTFQNIAPKHIKKLQRLKKWQSNKTSVKDNNSMGFYKEIVPMPALTEGKYILTARMKFCPFIVVKRILVTNKIIYSHQNKNSIDVIVLNRKTLKPVEGEEIKIASQKDTSLTKKTDKHGLVSIDNLFKSNSLYINSVLNPFSLNNSNNLNVRQEAKLSTIWTAAPIYKPGETVQFRGNIRSKGLMQSEAVKEKNITVSVTNNLSKTIWSANLKLSELGSFYGEFKLPLSSRTGEYNFVINHYSVSSFKVKAYRLPRFKFKLQNTESFHKIDTDYKNTVTLLHMNGSPMAGEEIELSLFGKVVKRSKLKTDEYGRADFVFNKEFLRKNDKQNFILSYTSPSGQIITESQEISYFFSPLYITLNCQHFPSESIYTTSVLFNWYDYIKPEKVEYLLLNENGGLIRKVKAMDQELVINKKDNVKSIKCIVSYKGYKNSKTITHKPITKASDKAFTISCRNSALDQQKVSLNLVWNTRSNKTARAYIFAQNTKTHFRKSIEVKPGANTIFLKADRNWGPNVFFHAVVFDHESPQQPLTDSCMLNIISKNKLNIQISTDKKTYKPGEKCTVTIHCKDMTQAPLVNTELSLAVLNESLFRSNSSISISSVFNQYLFSNIYQTSFDGYNEHAKSIKWFLGALETSLNIEDPRIQYVSKYGGSTVYCSAKTKKKGPRVKFNEIAEWRPLLVTDKEGKVTVTFNFPDTITNWVFDVKAISQQGIAGEVTYEANTNLDVETDIILPRVVRSGDKIGIPLQIINRSSDKLGLINAKVFHNKRTIKNVKNAAIEISPNSALGKFIFTTIPERGILKFTTDLTTDNHHDSVERELKISSKGYENKDYYYIGSNSQTKSIRLPSKGILPGTMNVEIQMETNLHNKILNALKKLKNYRYGCAEQTISRFTPLIVVNKSLEKAGMPSPYKNEMPEIIDEGLARLYRFQHADGGWKWYETGSSSYRVSALVLEGLLEAHSQKVNVDEDVIHRGANYLISQYNSDTIRKESVIGTGDRVDYFTSVVLSRYAYLFDKKSVKEAVEKKLEFLQKEKASNLESMYLCKALINLHQREKAQKLYETTISSPLTFKSRAEIIQVGTKLELDATLNPNKKCDAEIFELTKSRANGWWYDTYATHVAIRGLTKHIQNVQDNGSVNVFLNRRLVGRLNSAKPSLKLSGNECIGAKLFFINQGGSKYNALVNIRSFGSKKHVLKKPDAQIVATFREKNSQKALNSRESLKLSNKTFYTYELHLRSKVDLKFSRLSIPRPAGMELIGDPKLRNGIVSFEEYDDSLNFFIEDLKAGTYTLKLQFKADLPGEVFAPLPELQTMYGNPLRVNSYGPEKWIISNKN